VSLAIKRLVDIVGAATLTVVLSPLMAVIALAIKLDFARSDPVPPEEGGRSWARPIMVLKFRSMSSDAEQQLDYLRHHNEIKGHAFKLTNDPRRPEWGRYPAAIVLTSCPAVECALGSDEPGWTPPTASQRSCRLRTGLAIAADFR